MPNASLFVIIARILTFSPPPYESLRTCLVCATHAHSPVLPAALATVPFGFVLVVSSSSSPHADFDIGPAGPELEG